MKKLINTTMALSVAAMPSFAQTTEWQHFNMNNSNLPSNAVTAVEANSLGLWVGTEQGLAHIGGELLPDMGIMGSPMPQSRIHGLHTAADGTLWVATDAGLAFHTDRMWTVLSTSNSDIPTDLIRCVTTDSYGNVWAGTWGSGLLRFREGEWEVFNTDNSGIPSNGIYTVAVDDAGRVWAGTYARGAAVLDGDLWTVHDAQSCGLPDNHVRSIIFGHDGAVWLGTENGLARMMPDNEGEVQTFTSIYFGRSVHAFRSGVTDEKGVTWFATDAGLLRWEDGIFSFLHMQNSGIASNNLAAVAADGQGNILIGHAQKGLDVYNPDGVALPVHPAPPREKTAVEIYPNPTTDILNVRAAVKGDADMTMTVNDLTGRILMHLRMPNVADENRVDVTTLPSGTYLLTVRSADNIATAPFVKW